MMVLRAEVQIEPSMTKLQRIEELPLTMELTELTMEWVEAMRVWMAMRMRMMKSEMVRVLIPRESTTF